MVGATTQTNDRPCGAVSAGNDGTLRNLLVRNKDNCDYYKVYSNNSFTVDLVSVDGSIGFLIDLNSLG
jgi:hypothetical protein